MEGGERKRMRKDLRHSMDRVPFSAMPHHYSYLVDFLMSVMLPGVLGNLNTVLSYISEMTNEVENFYIFIHHFYFSIS